MRNGFLGSLGAVLAGTGLALAQPPAPAGPPMPATGTPMAPAAQPAPAPAAAQPSGAPATGTAAAGQASQGCNNGTRYECVICEPPFCYPGRFYASAEYLLWWAKGDKLPPLITTGTPGTLSTTAALGQPGTVVLFGDEKVDDEVRSGFRTTAGYWLNPEQTVGLEATFFYLSPDTTDFTASSSPARPVLARPYVNFDLINRGLTPNLTTSPENALLVAFPVLGPGFPGSATGTASARASNKVWGVESNGRINIAGNQNYRADVLAGFRYLDEADDLSIVSTSNPAPGSLVVFRDGRGPATRTNAQSVSILDSFNTRNQFYGGQLGANLTCRWGRLSADFLGKLALGVMHQDVDIRGASTLVTTAGQTSTVPVGLLAGTSNSGSHTRDQFGIVPEAGLTLGYWVTSHIKGFVGYSIIYWRSDVVRPGQEIDRVVNPSFVPTLNTGLNPQPLPPNLRPAFQFVDDDFWVQGLNFGVQVSF